MGPVASWPPRNGRWWPASCGRSRTSSWPTSTGAVPRPRPIPLSKIVDLADGSVAYDETYHLKRSDWTYAAPDDVDLA